MTLQELAQDDFAFQAEASASAAPVVRRKPDDVSAPRRSSSAERNRNSFFPPDGAARADRGGGGSDSGSDYDESTIDPAAMSPINEGPGAAAGGGGGRAAGKASTLPAGMSLQRRGSSAGIFDPGALPAGLTAGSVNGGSRSPKPVAVADRIGLTKTVKVLSPSLVAGSQEFYMPTSDSSKYVSAGFLIKNKFGKDVLEIEGRSKFSAKKAMVLKFSMQMYGVYLTPDVDKLEVAHISYKKKECVFEIQGYEPCYDGQAVADKKEGRYAWAKMYAESATKVGIGIAAEEGSKKGTHEFHEMYTIEFSGGAVWEMSRVGEDDHEEKYPVATITTASKDFYTGTPLEVQQVNSVANEDCALALVAAALLGDISLIL